MKVLVVATWYPSQSKPNFGVFVQDQVRALAKRYEVAVLAPEHLSLRPGVNIERDGPVLVVRPRFLMPPVRWFGWNEWSSRLYLRGSLKALKVLDREWGKPDVIHAHVAFPGGWVGDRVHELTGAPLVVTEHTSDFPAHLRPAFRKRATIRTLRDASMVIAVSDGLQQKILESTGVPSIVVANSFDTKFFAPRGLVGTGAALQILTVGHLVRRKGVDILLSACARLRHPWELSVGGDGPERMRLQSMAVALGIADHVHFLGALSRDAVRNSMARSDLFVLSSFHENLPGVIAEAMLVGLPVVATRSGGPEYMVPDGLGTLVPVGETEALAAAIEEWADRVDLFDGARARAWAVDHFGEERFLERISSVYAAVVA